LIIKKITSAAKSPDSFSNPKPAGQTKLNSTAQYAGRCGQGCRPPVKLCKRGKRHFNPLNLPGAVTVNKKRREPEVRAVRVI
jgi:hypothetical protein